MIIIGVSGSIAAYKAVELVREFKDFNVVVIMTKHATKIIDRKEFKNVPVISGLFKKGWNYKKYLEEKRTKHISLAEQADIIVIAPATANIIGKIANGIADDLLTTTVMATKAPVVICPAMNFAMWENPILQENIKKLKRLGYFFIEPETGKLLCGCGKGRLANIKQIKEFVVGILAKRAKLKNKKILVSAGATYEEIDPVRIITNKSSGKMGIYLAEEAAKRGAKVTLIRASTTIEPSGCLKDIKVGSAKEMFNEIKKNINQDIIIHAAAVSDFTLNKENKKLSSEKELMLELTPTTKILDKIKHINRAVFLVGFKAEYKVTKEELIRRAYKKLVEANADLIIANDIGRPGRGFMVDTNEVYIIDKEKQVKHLGLNSKRVIASQIMDYIVLKNG